MNTTESPRFTNARFKFFDGIFVVESYLREEVKIYPQTTVIECWPLDLQGLPSPIYSLIHLAVSKIGSKKVGVSSKQGERDGKEIKRRDSLSVSTEIRRARETGRDRTDSCSAGGRRGKKESTLGE